LLCRLRALRSPMQLLRIWETLRTRASTGRKRSRWETGYDDDLCLSTSHHLMSSTQLEKLVICPVGMPSWSTDVASMCQMAASLHAMDVAMYYSPQRTDSAPDSPLCALQRVCVLSPRSLGVQQSPNSESTNETECERSRQQCDSAKYAIHTVVWWHAHFMTQTADQYSPLAAREASDNSDDFDGVSLCICVCLCVCVCTCVWVSGCLLQCACASPSHMLL
jgi:hypothetical protein